MIPKRNLNNRIKIIIPTTMDTIVQIIPTYDEQYI